MGRRINPNISPENPFRPPIVDAIEHKDQNLLKNLIIFGLSVYSATDQNGMKIRALELSCQNNVDNAMLSILLEHIIPKHIKNQEAHHEQDILRALIVCVKKNLMEKFKFIFNHNAIGAQLKNKALMFVTSVCMDDVNSLAHTLEVEIKPEILNDVVSSPTFLAFMIKDFIPQILKQDSDKITVENLMHYYCIIQNIIQLKRHLHHILKQPEQHHATTLRTEEEVKYFAELKKYFTELNEACDCFFTDLKDKDINPAVIYFCEYMQQLDAQENTSEEDIIEQDILEQEIDDHTKDTTTDVTTTVEHTEHKSGAGAMIETQLEDESEESLMKAIERSEFLRSTNWDAMYKQINTLKQSAKKATSADTKQKMGWLLDDGQTIKKTDTFKVHDPHTKKTSDCYFVLHPQLEKHYDYKDIQRYKEAAQQYASREKAANGIIVLTPNCYEVKIAKQDGRLFSNSIYTNSEDEKLVVFDKCWNHKKIANFLAKQRHKLPVKCKDFVYDDSYTHPTETDKSLGERIDLIAQNYTKEENPADLSIDQTLIGDQETAYQSELDMSNQGV